MTTLNTSKTSDFDKDGFLINPDQWNEEFACTLAHESGISELTSDHWAVIHSLREHYFRFHAPPPMRHICQINRMDKHCVDNLFDHHSREAWRIAGLPNPGEEAVAYMI